MTVKEKRQNVELSENEQENNDNQPTKPGRLIYCGPNLPGGILFKYQVFKGGYPEHLKDVFEKCPAIKEMFIPVADLNKVRINKDKPGTLENKLISDIEKFIQGGVK